MVEECGRDFKELIYLYCEEGEEARRLKESSEWGGRVVNCGSLLPFTSPEHKPRLSVPTNMQILQARKIEKACLHVLKERYQSLDEILAYFWEVHFNRK